MSHGAVPLRRSSEVAFVVSEAERVALLDLRRLDEPPVILEGSSAVIWQSVDGRTEPEVVDAVAEAYAVPADTVRDDVLAFVTDLRRRGWVEDET